jgi:hypothetical protein
MVVDVLLDAVVDELADDPVHDSLGRRPTPAAAARRGQQRPTASPAPLPHPTRLHWVPLPAMMPSWCSATSSA